MSNSIIGIDLGTTNSVMALMEGRDPIIILNSEGFRTTPSIVAYVRLGEKLVGQIAKRQLVLNPLNTFYSTKRFIGRTSNEVVEELKQVSYKVQTDNRGNLRFDCPLLGKQFSPEEIAAEILRKLVFDAGQYTGETIRQSVITVPAYFNDAQRQATKDAGIIAGIEVLRIINEPTAAALAYGLDKKVSETVLIFDLGGGTFDVSILEVGDGVFEVLATNGDTHLGGDDFDQKVVHWVLSRFKEDHDIDLRTDSQALQRVTEAAEKAKVELSSLTQTVINIPFIIGGGTPGVKHLEYTLTRAKFEELCAPLLARVKNPVYSALKDAKLKVTKIDEVVLVGGSTRIPAVREFVKKAFSKDPNQTVNPDEVVAIGAAIQGGVLTGEVKGLILLDVTPLSLGVETFGGIRTCLIPRNTTIPVKKSSVFSTADDNQPAVDVKVLQGERAFACDNKLLGTFQLQGIAPAPRGVPQIEVIFDIDGNGILSVTAKDKASGREQAIKIIGTSTLPKEEIARMLRESEQNAASDLERKEKIDLKNEVSTDCYRFEKQMEELSHKITPDDMKKLKDLIERIKVLLKSDDCDQLKSLLGELRQTWINIGAYGPDIPDTNNLNEDDVTFDA